MPSIRQCPNCDYAAVVQSRPVHHYTPEGVVRCGLCGRSIPGPRVADLEVADPPLVDIGACSVTLGGVNNLLRKIGLVLVIGYDPSHEAPTQLWIQRWSTYPK